jgi:hypothetical protein
LSSGGKIKSHPAGSGHKIWLSSGGRRAVKTYPAEIKSHPAVWGSGRAIEATPRRSAKILRSVIDLTDLSPAC